MDHGIGIFKDDHVEARVGPHTVFIRQDRVTVIDLTGHIACDRMIKSYGDPFYVSLEGFARRAGAGFRVGRGRHLRRHDPLPLRPPPQRRVDALARRHAHRPRGPG